MFRHVVLYPLLPKLCQGTASAKLCFSFRPRLAPCCLHDNFAIAMTIVIATITLKVRLANSGDRQNPLREFRGVPVK